MQLIVSEVYRKTLFIKIKYNIKYYCKYKILWYFILKIKINISTLNIV